MFRSQVTINYLSNLVNSVNSLQYLICNFTRASPIISHYQHFSFGRFINTIKLDIHLSFFLIYSVFTCGFIMTIKTDKLLSVFLWLVAIHSFLVGIGLIVLPSSFFELLGFTKTFDRFFSTQGGVFHIAMSVGYAIAAYDKIKFRQIILFSIIVKFIATAFLITYFLFITSQWLIILSGISDFLMGIIIHYLYQLLLKENYYEQKII